MAGAVHIRCAEHWGTTLNIFQEEESKWFPFEGVCVLPAQQTAAAIRGLCFSHREMA